MASSFEELLWHLDLKLTKSIPHALGEATEIHKKRRRDDEAVDPTTLCSVSVLIGVHRADQHIRKILKDTGLEKNRLYMVAGVPPGPVPYSNVSDARIADDVEAGIRRYKQDFRQRVGVDTLALGYACLVPPLAGARQVVANAGGDPDRALELLRLLLSSTQHPTTVIPFGSAIGSAEGDDGTTSPEPCTTTSSPVALESAVGDGGEHNREPVLQAQNAPMRGRVFISSVMEGFSAMRAAARRGIEAAGAQPVLIEDYPSLNVSPRTACLDAVASADALVVIIGARGGFEAPSGQLVVAEEVAEARQHSLPVLVFLQEVAREPAADALAADLSAYVTGRYRTSFTDAEALETQVQRAVARLVTGRGENVRDLEGLDMLATAPARERDEVLVRVVVAPERNEEVIDPVRLGSAAFCRELYELGHRPGIDFWAYERAKHREIDEEWLDIAQTRQERHHEGIADARLRLREDGTLVLERTATNHEQSDTSLAGLGLSSMVLAHEDVEQALAVTFAFAAVVFDHVDPYHRYARVGYQVGLLNIGHRTLERNPQPRTTFSVPHQAADDPLQVLPRPRTISRQQLAASAPEVERLLALLSRRLAADR